MFSGCASRPSGMVPATLFFAVFIYFSYKQVCIDHARSNRIDPNAIWPKFTCHRLRERLHCTLGSRIVRPAEDAATPLRSV